MRAVDKLAQVVRRSVEVKWREKIDSIVAPSEISREIGDRHHFNNSDADPCQLGQLFRRRAPSSLFRKNTDVHFVNNLAFHLHAAPF